MERKKATFKSIPTYYNFRKYNGGTLYYLSEKVTEDEKAALLKKYNNIVFYKVRAEYAPELITDALLIK